SFEPADRRIFENAAVYDGFDAADVFRGNRFEMGEVEAETILGDERTGLPDVRSENFAEGVVEQVGGGVVALDAVAEGEIDFEFRFGAGFQGSVVFLDLMEVT